MKKKLFIILGSVLFILILLSLYTSYVDSARVRNGIEPKFTIKIMSNKENKITYLGLGYKVIRYVKVSFNEPYKNNAGVKYGSWFMKYVLDTDNKIVEIIDTTKNIKNFSCAETLESFYEDDKYIYYYNCIKSSYVLVKFKDGSQITVEEALKNNKITIKDLDEYKIDYIKENK